MTDIPKPLREFLEKSGYVEQSPKDWFILKVNDTEIAVDLRGDAPKVGVQIGGVIQEEGHGILRVQDIRNKVEYLWSKGAGNGKNVKKEAKSDPAPQPNQWKCDKCGTMNGEILDFCKDCGMAKGYAPPEIVGPDPAKFSDVIARTSTLLDLIKSYVGNDVLEVFGDSGTGKSKFALELARQVIASGKTVFYLDTERNLTEKDIAMLKGCQYKYTPVIAEIGQITRRLPQVDVVVIDSIGFPVLTAYARMSMKQKGDALLNLIAIFGDLKEWAYRNNGVAVVINQPESEFNKEQGHLLRPFGDKSQFAAKEIWKTEIVQRGKVTKTTINAFRSRSLGHGTKIADMEVSDKGVMIKQAQEVK